jgi:hypothetical protein
MKESPIASMQTRHCDASGATGRARARLGDGRSPLGVRAPLAAGVRERAWEMDARRWRARARLGDGRSPLGVCERAWERLGSKEEWRWPLVAWASGGWWRRRMDGDCVRNPKM